MVDAMVHNFRRPFCGQHLVLFLLCIGLQASSNYAISERPHEHSCGHDDACDDTVSMLQLRTEHPRSKSSTYSVPLFGSWVLKEYHVIAQHKSGTVMGVEAVKGMVSTLRLHSPVIDAPESTLGRATNISMMQTPKPACHVHMARNPFELVVSSYMYHMAGAEPAWTQDIKFGDLLDLDDCTLIFHGGRMSPFCSSQRGLQSYAENLRLKGLADVFHSSHSGNLSAWLPHVKANESWAGYFNVWTQTQASLPMSSGLPPILYRKCNLPTTSWTHSLAL